jgi:indolepyruvate ferredoxin oxidoreductase
VIEDKRPFVERQLRDLLYGVSDPPRVLGKHDADGRELIALSGTVDADQVARALARVFGDRLPDHCAERVAEARERVRAGAQLPPLPIARTPFFCSGCPHNLSTRTPEDQLVGAGIGCHSLIWVDRPGRRGQILGAPQMGGEGAQWLGMAPFTADRHYVQNMGDGTFHHSGSLAIRAAVAAGSQITFRLLYNDAIAMTGGQAAPGRMGVPELTRWLQTEGVKRVIITTEDVGSFDGAALASGVTLRDRAQLQDALTELERTLIDEHHALTRRALMHLDEANADAVAEIAGLADLIRGYEQVKLRAVERYRTAAANQFAGARRLTGSLLIGRRNGVSDFGLALRPSRALCRRALCGRVLG